MRTTIAFVIFAFATIAFAADDKPAQKTPVGSDKQPVTIPHAADAITVDGDGADWAKITALPAPYSRKDAGSVKLAWRDDGLYGLITVSDAKISIDETNPWSADCVEFWLDPKFSRATDMTGGAMQIAFAPNPTAGAGKAVLAVPQGTVDTSAVKVMWKPVTGNKPGYTIEFFIPTKELAGAKMAEGTKLGMNYSIDDDGAAAEQFFTDKDTDSGYSNPSLWGVMQLGK